jgi:hypothetical protein
VGNAQKSNKLNGTYAYQWQSSPDNSNWTSINPFSGGTALFYAPGALSTPMYYRMQVTSNTVIAYSASASVGMTSCILLNTMPSQNLAYIITSTPRGGSLSESIEILKPAMAGGLFWNT